jgi:uncharacterized protein (TIGR02217 family)
MTTPPAFPQLAGQGWSVHKTPSFQTLVAAHASGREVREALYQNPIWEFELVFDGLDGTNTGQYGGLGASSLQSLMGLFLSCQGSYSTFLYADPTDDSASGQLIGVGDGTTTTFVMQRTLGAFTEPVGWVTAIASVSVAGSVAPSSSYSLTTPNSLVFNTAPASGLGITATFNYAFQCRFSDDKLDFEQFMSNLWKVDSMKFKSVRAF